MADLPTDLLRPSAYPDPPDRVEPIETHISWVFLAGNDVYKVKKPVDFGFLDFRSLAQRFDACTAEVSLNSRLAPGIYLGVVPIRCDAGGVCRIDGLGTIVDWAVHMVRLPDGMRADNLLLCGELSGDTIDALADRLADFHAESQTGEAIARFGEVEAITRNVRENFTQTRDAVERYGLRAEADEVERRQMAFLRDHAALFEARIAAGHIRDGHGDLRLEHVYVERGGVKIIDCIEYCDRFRFADVCADVAFLSMDLAWHGRVDLAERFLARYAQRANDFDLYGLVDFYESYRAYVRAKVSMFLAEAAGVDERVRRRAEAEARRYILLALAANRPGLLPPALVCIGGIVATGKSTVAAHIAGELGAPVVEADRTRKSLLGVAPAVHLDELPWHGAYDPSVTDRVYDEVFRRARVVLGSGRPVIVDASFRSREMRSRARNMAAAARVPFIFVECRVAAEVARARLRRRWGVAGVSDARVDIFKEFCARFESPDELSPGAHLVLDTGRPLEGSLATLRERLAVWPRGLVA